MVSDVCLLGWDGLVFYEEICVICLSLLVIFLIVYGFIFDVVDVILRGVFGYLIKFFDS